MGELQWSSASHCGGWEWELQLGSASPPGCWKWGLLGSRASIPGGCNGRAAVEQRTVVAGSGSCCWAEPPLMVGKPGC